MNLEEYSIGWIGNVEQPLEPGKIEQGLTNLLEVVGQKLDVPFDDPSRANIPQVADWLAMERNFRLLTLGQALQTWEPAQAAANNAGVSVDDTSLQDLPEIRAWLRMKSAWLPVTEVLTLLKTSNVLDPEMLLPVRIDLASKLAEDNLRKDLLRGGQIVVGENIYSREQALNAVLGGSRDAGNIIKVSLYFGKAVFDTSGINQRRARP